MNTTNEILSGEERRPVNPAQSGSIHDDSVAQKLGFRGGTIAGSIHLEQFVPLLLEAFGPEWFRSGSLSMYFRYATMHREPVRCFVRKPENGTDAQVEAWMDTPAGQRVCEGTASVGRPDALSALREKLQNLPPRGDVRILSRLQPGARMAARPVRIEGQAVVERLKFITEPLDAYRDPARFGGIIVPPVFMIRALRAAEGGIEGIRSERAVGLFGAIEARNVNGPVFADRDYSASGAVLAVGETPRSEYFWYESELRERDGEPVVASMIMMLRFMKASSRLWEQS